MNTKKKRKPDIKDTDDQNLERIHRTLFDHPDPEEWNATLSLAQPSFLKQIDSYSDTHSKPLAASQPVTEND